LFILSHCLSRRVGILPLKTYSEFHLAEKTVSCIMKGNMSIPFGVKAHMTRLGRDFISFRKRMPCSSNSQSLRESILGVRPRFDASRRLNRSMFLKPISVTINSAHFRPSTPRLGLIGRDARSSSGGTVRFMKSIRS